MPRPRQSNIGRRSRDARRLHNIRIQETDAQRSQRLVRLHENHLLSQRQRLQQNACPRTINEFERLAFAYHPATDFSQNAFVVIGPMNKLCQYCLALKYKHESPGMCCSNGKIVLPELNQPPERLLSLMSGNTPDSRHFLNNIRTYNSSFQMTSFGATKIEQNNFMPTFKIQGQIYHQAGSLLPLPNEEHKFLQIYFMGSAENGAQVEQRLKWNPGAKHRILAELQQLFHEHNELVRLFKSAIDNMPSDEYSVVIRADKRPPGEHERRFNAPTVNEVAIVIVGDQFERRDIIIKRRSGNIQRVAETHRSYDALQYPVIFWQGEDGYHFNIKHVNPSTGADTNKKVSAMDFYAYRLMIRQDADNHILSCRQLFHQFVVDMYAKIETERLLYIRLNQAKLRADDYIHLRDAVQNDENVRDLGTMVILPSTFIGSPRHMQEYAQDAMAYVHSYGTSDLFITFKCNPMWTEILQELKTGQKSTDRHDLTARVFKQKLKSLMNLIVKCKVFGKVRCWMYSIEWQKRGLPHAHILIWLVHKITPQEIDQVISAEIPDPQIDPELHEVVTTKMVHGPCGLLNPNSQCMKEGKCSVRYPRQLISETISGTDGYPLYRRRSTDNGGHSITKRITNRDIDIDNRWIVPYSPLLSKIYKAHINVEYCNSVKSIKYICKYVNKGSDMAVFAMASQNDEIAQYQMGRYISSNEAVWRILGIPIHERYPAVIHLAVHLENGQRVFFTADSARERAATPPKTTLTAFFDLCRDDLFARTLLYTEVPTYFTSNPTLKKFQRRKQGTAVEGWNNVYSNEAMGRLYTVHPNNQDCFFLRLLLINVRGPISFETLKTVNGQVCATYRDACQLLQLLESDTHWDITIQDAIISRHPTHIRFLFAIILTTCFPSNPKHLWDKYKNDMTEDILHCGRSTNNNMEIEFLPEMYNEALILIEDICMMIVNKQLNQLGLHAPNRAATDLNDRDLRREKEFNMNDLQEFLQTNMPKLLQQQRTVYNTIMEAIRNECGQLYFLDAPGGTGKTFLLSLILAKVRSQNNIALAIASTGIAATLLDGGRTAHSALKLPLNLHVQETPTCNIRKNSGMAEVLQTCKIIVWDECTIAHKKALEALDRTLQDLRDNTRPFGGALILLAGDFRQTLPIIPRSTPADEINGCLKMSYLWRHVHKLQLRTNMRVQLQNDETASRFAEQLLEMGDGKIPMDESTNCITLQRNFCKLTQSITELIECVFPCLQQNYINHRWLHERAILAAKNIDVDVINEVVLTQIPGHSTKYKSIDSVVLAEDAVNYPIEFLNSLNLPGLPPHELDLKIGAVIILLRNLKPPMLCNGTRLAVKRLLPNIIEATILTGKFEGEDVLLPRIPIIPTDTPFQFKRLQFPVRLAFAMTINKAQGQSLQVCGINLENPCFAHGQLYVACSRVGKPNDLYVFAPESRTKNVVYLQALF